MNEYCQGPFHSETPVEHLEACNQYLLAQTDSPDLVISVGYLTIGCVFVVGVIGVVILGCVAWDSLTYNLKR